MSVIGIIAWAFIAILLAASTMIGYLQGEPWTKKSFYALLGYLAISLSLSLLGPSPMGHD